MHPALRTLLSLAVLVPAVAGADHPLRGAAAVLAVQVAPAAAKAPTQEPARPAIPAALADLKDPTAKAWLDVARQVAEDKTPGNVQALLARLPPVATWDALIAGLAPERGPWTGAGWRLLRSALAGDEVALWQDVERLSGRRHGISRVRSLAECLAKGTVDPEHLRLLLDFARAESGSRSVDLPDVAGLLDRPAATALLDEALAIPRLDVRVEGEASQALARERALRQGPALAARPWGLTAHQDGGPLFELLRSLPDGQQGENTREGIGYERQDAYAWHLLRLLIAGDGSAAAFLGDLQPRERVAIFGRLDVDALAQQVPKNTLNLLEGLVAENPAGPWWTPYSHLAVRSGQTARLKAMLAQHAARLTFPRDLTDLLLAADLVDEAIADITARSTAKPSIKDLTTRLRLGRLLGRTGDLATALTAVEQLATQAPAKTEEADWETLYSLGGLTRELLAVDRADLAEAILAAHLPCRPGIARRSYSFSSADEPLIELVRLYHHVHRPADAVAVLEQGLGWESEDLAQVSDHHDLHDGIPPLAAIVAQDLLAVGRTADAARVARFAVEQTPASDAAWQALLAADPQGIPATVDLIRARSPLEERPLIWRATIRLAAGDAAGAEADARLAMQMDPSDGDQGPGDRMRARSVLADALDRLGRSDAAKPLRTAVAAIRIGEEGDVLYRAGLTTRALGPWQRSADLLDRTYCVQSRLAITLAKAGDKAGAAAHFRRAYELMPNAFGRQESHCFGCEGVFSLPEAQAIAVEVFTALVARDPANPRHHYLLGYVRQAQGRWSEAAASYQEAVRLDPDYFSAWRGVLRAASHARIPRAILLAGHAAVIRLGDPQERAGELDDIPDLRAAAQALEARPLPLVTSGPVLALHGERHGASEDAMSEAPLLRHPFLTTAVELIDEATP